MFPLFVPLCSPNIGLWVPFPTFWHVSLFAVLLAGGLSWAHYGVWWGRWLTWSPFICSFCFTKWRNRKLSLSQIHLRTRMRICLSHRPFSLDTLLASANNCLQGKHLKNPCRKSERAVRRGRIGASCSVSWNRFENCQRGHEILFLLHRQASFFLGYYALGNWPL